MGIYLNYSWVRHFMVSLCSVFYLYRHLPLLGFKFRQINSIITRYTQTKDFLCFITMVCRSSLDIGNDNCTFHTLKPRQHYTPLALWLLSYLKCCWKNVQNRYCKIYIHWLHYTKLYWYFNFLLGKSYCVHKFRTPCFSSIWNCL